MKEGYLRGALSPQATQRQMDVLAAYVVAGGSVTEAAELVGIRPGTVKRHLADLRARSGLHLGVDWRVSADQTGHTTAAMQKHYSHGSPESRRQAAATFQAGLDAVPPRTPDQTPDQTKAR